MATTQEIFDTACGHYNEAMEMIEKLGAIVRSTNYKFSDNIAKREFDYILQCILIEVAIGDGNFSRIEAQFIEKITDRGDILVYINNRYPTETQITWETLFNCDTSAVQFLSLILDKLIESKIDDFVSFFAAIDAATPDIDICDFFVKKLVAIGAGLALVDGFVSDGEREAVSDKIYSVFYRRWQKQKNEFLAMN